MESINRSHLYHEWNDGIFQEHGRFRGFESSRFERERVIKKKRDMETKEEEEDLMNVSHALLIGMSDHPCLKVCCEKKDCSIGRLLRGKRCNSEWNHLLTISNEVKGLSQWQPRTISDKNKENEFKNLKQEYYTSRRVLMQAQGSFKSRQKVEFASLLKVQLKMKSELEMYRKRADQIERQLKAFLANSDAYKQIIRNVDNGIDRKVAKSEKAGDTEDEDLTSPCPDGFELKEWLKLSSEARLIVLDQFQNAMSLALAKHMPDHFDTKDIKEEEEEDDGDMQVESFEDDIALLESEASEMNSNSAKKNGDGQTQNLAEVVEMNVNNMSSSIRVRYIQSRETEVVDTSEVTMSRSSQGNASKGVNLKVVRPVRPNSKITTSSIVGLKSLEGYDNDDSDDDYADDDRNEEKTDSDKDTSKKRKMKKNMGQLARERYLIVKTNDELSTVLHISNGAMEAPKALKLDVNIIKELMDRKMITPEDYRHVKNQITTSTYLSVDNQLHVGSVVVVDRSSSRSSMITNTSSKEKDIDSKLKTIHEDLKKMNASMTRMETSLDIIEDNDSHNRWCWQRWWHPSSLLDQKSRMEMEQEDEKYEKKKREERSEQSSLSCFCWGADDHSQLGNYEDSSTQTQDFNKAGVNKLKPMLSTLDRPLAMLVRQIVCSRYQTVILLHEGIVLTTVKINPMDKSAFYNKDNTDSNDDNDNDKSKKRKARHYAEFVQIPFPKGMMPVQFIAAGEDHFLALTDDVSDNLYSWGSNTYGQLGLGHKVDKKNPSPVVFPEMHYRAKITFASCGTNFSFCVTSTNQVFSWGANDKGQLAQWKKSTRQASMVLAPQLCSAWETYREKNLPYFEDITINDSQHCPIKDGWKTFRRLLIACGQDHAFSWQTTNDQLKSVHGYADRENEVNQKFHSYTALCPRSQNYSRDMSAVMDSLQKVLSKYELLKVRYKHLKKRAGRWRQHVMHSTDSSGGDFNTDSTSTDRVKNTLASTVVKHSLESSDFFVHQRASLKEIRKKRRATREKLGLLERERAKLKDAVNVCQRQLDAQNNNLSVLTSEIESGKVAIENYKRRIQELKTQSNETAMSGAKSTIKIENEIKSLEAAKEKVSREFDVNVELHKYGKVSLNTRKLNELQRQIESVESKIDYETDKFHMFTKESEALKDSLTEEMRRAKRNVFADASSLPASTSSKESTNTKKATTSNQLDTIIQTAIRLKTRLDRSSIQVICKQRMSLDDPSKIAQAMIERTETEILRELHAMDGDLMGDVKQVLRNVLLQNCQLRRQANGLRQASDKVTMATKQKTKEGVIETKVLFDSDSGSDEYISAGPH